MYDMTMRKTPAHSPDAVRHFNIEPERGWRRVLLDMGHFRAVALITVVSIAMSLLLTTLVSVVLDNVTYLLIDLVIAFIIPLVIAPLASYYGMGLLYEIESARAQLQIAVIRDSLTGLYNRAFLQARLIDEVERVRRTEQPLSLILMDVDHFKDINDCFGHARGDEVLKELSQVLAESLRPCDLVARYGGEEFVALLPGVDLAEAQLATERIRIALESMSFSQGVADNKQPQVTASFGVTCLGGPHDSAEDLLARADRAMYAAKNAGRNRHMVAAPVSL